MSARFAEVAALFGARLLFMEKLNSLLNRPEYVHAALNHFPLIGLFVGPVVLVLGYELFRAWLAGPDAVAAEQMRPQAAEPPVVPVVTVP